MDFIEPDFDEFMIRLENRKDAQRFPSNIADAMNIICHEKVPRQGEWAWIDDDDPPCDPSARKIADGYVDKLKQDALYVRLGKTGRVASTPLRIDAAEAKAEYDRSARLGQLFSRKDGTLQPTMSLEYEMIFETFRLLFGLTTIEDYGQHWWA